MIRKVTKVWRTSRGEKIRICDMTNVHLQNAICSLKRGAQISCDKAIREVDDVYCSSFYPQGEMAQLCLEQDIDAVMSSTWEDYVAPAYYDLLVEQERRERLGLIVSLISFN